MCVQDINYNYQNQLTIKKTNMKTIEQIKALAKEEWDASGGSSDNNQYYFITGYSLGYLKAQLESVKKRTTNKEYIEFENVEQ